MSGPRVIVDGHVVRIIADTGAKLDVPRRQSFAWAKDAERYAKRLSAEHSWPIEVARGEAR